MSSEIIGAKAEITGGAVNLNIAVGGAVSRSVVLYGEIIGSTISNPTLKIDDVSVTANNVSASAIGIGLGVAYYLPDNTYFSGTIASTTLEISDNNQNTNAETDSGLGFTLQVGHEWWASDNWGVGVAGQFLHASVQDKPTDGGTPPTWSTNAFGLLCSASYN